MDRPFSALIRFAVIFGLSVGLAAGCQRKDSPQAGPDGGSGKTKVLPNGSPEKGSRRLGDIASNEDPEVADFFKKKGWSLARDRRLSDGKPVIYLTIENRDKPAEDAVLTADDCQMIARSRTAQVLDLRKLKNTDDELKAIVGIPQLEGIIVTGDNVTDAGMKALAQSRSLDNITLLTKGVTDAGIKELAALPKLRSLYLMGMTLTGSAFEAFAGSKNLESVTLEYVDGFTDDGARCLARLPNLNQLKIGISFREKKLTAAGIKAIVEARLPAKFEFDKKLLDDDLLEALVAKGFFYGPMLPGARDKRPATPAEVKFIALSDSKVTDKGLQAMLNCTNITSLHLDRTGVTDETLKKLSGFKNLEYVGLEKTKVTAAGLEAVSGLPLRHVLMGGCELSEDTFKAFGKMTALEELWLSDSKMKADWLKHIATLPKLKDLNLMRADCDDSAVKYLATLPNLQDLTLNNTSVGDTGFQELLKMPKLRSLLVDGTKVSKEVYQQARKEHPNLRLYFSSYDQ